MHGTARGSKSVPRSLNHQTTRRFFAKVSSDSKSNDDDEMAFCVKGNFICDVYRILRFSDPPPLLFVRKLYTERGGLSVVRF